MHFGEYELSPSLISLSPLHTTHPKIFQHSPVRSSSWCYPTFNLVMCRSLGFASTPADYRVNTKVYPYSPYSDSLSLRLRYCNNLTLPTKVTRRFIMQKARRHTIYVLRPLVGRRVQGLFHSFIQGSFHLSLTVLVRYRSLGSI